MAKTDPTQRQLELLTRVISIQQNQISSLTKIVTELGFVNLLLGGTGGALQRVGKELRQLAAALPPARSQKHAVRVYAEKVHLLSSEYLVQLPNMLDELRGSLGMAQLYSKKAQRKARG